MELLEGIVKNLLYWVFGVIYIGVLMGGAWLWNKVFGDGVMTLTETLIAAAIVFVPIVVGKVITSSDD